MTYDGFLVYATSAGRVGAVSRDFNTASEILQLPGRDKALMPLRMISNNFAIDQVAELCSTVRLLEEQRHLHCDKHPPAPNPMEWHKFEPCHQVFHEIHESPLTLSWSTSYSDGADPWFYGRLGPGCTIF